MLLRNVNRGNKSRDFILPAPIKGLNKRDSLSAMDSLYAITMDNYIPLDNKIELRSGYESYVKIGHPIHTLVSYTKPLANQFIALANNKAYNITSKANVRVYNATFSNTYCQTVQYKDRLFFLNGEETPKVFYVDDDSVEHLENWGFTSDNPNFNAGKIINGAVSHEFLWFVEKNSLKAWYSAEAGNIAGKLYQFDLAQISKWGGELIAVANWSVDGGAGMDDLTVFLTSKGECLVYKGINPNSANNWEIVGSYKLSEPIGYNCIMQYQGDLVIISQDGYIPLSKALSLQNANSSSVAFSDAIRGLVLDRTSANKDRKGWQGIIYSKRGYAIFNVPVNNQFEQHVINLTSGAWCRFTGIRSYQWCLFDNNMYFASDDYVYQYDTNTYSDNGVQIEGKIEQAYSNLGTDSLKTIPLLNPRTRSSTSFALTIYTNMDFEDQNRNYYTNIQTIDGTKWDVSKWSHPTNLTDTKWSTLSTSRIQNQWIANNSTGFKASVVFKTKTKGNIIEWYDTGIRYEIGNGIL